ncbi:EthD family reductase [Streptomyces sp. NPDC096079]|uniref:EthD family reductase n=1 Tax=Streptomyces sp. NPDC096079 TaxID=3155820 RepID=UPI00331F0B09
MHAVRHATAALPQTRHTAPTRGPSCAAAGHFRDYYLTKHLPLVKDGSGPLAWRYNFDVAALEGEAPYFAIFGADFADAASMDAALASPHGERLAADVANYAAGGVGIIHYQVLDGTG